MKRRRLLNHTNRGYKNFARLNDIVYYDLDKQIFTITSKDNYEMLDETRYRPVAVVVRESIDGVEPITCMSLNDMDITNPEDGCTKDHLEKGKMKWTTENNLINIGNSYEKVVTSGQLPNSILYDSIESNLSLQDSGRLCTYIFSYWEIDRNASAIPNKVGYQIHTGSDYTKFDKNYVIPSPYRTTDGFYEDMSQQIAKIEENESFCKALKESVTSDLNGVLNTNIILSNANSTSWQNSNITTFPAAMCCWRYRPSYNGVYLGTKYGDWYLPSAGEIGFGLLTYCFFRVFVYNGFKDKFSVNIDMPAGKYWTSSISFNEKKIWVTDNLNKSGDLAVLDALLTKTTFDDTCNVRAFLKIKPENYVYLKL